ANTRTSPWAGGPEPRSSRRRPGSPAPGEGRLPAWPPRTRQNAAAGPGFRQSPPGAGPADLKKTAGPHTLCGPRRWLSGCPDPAEAFNYRCRMGTFTAKSHEVRRGWYVVDATDQTL